MELAVCTAMDYSFHCMTFLFQPQLNRMAKESVNTQKWEMLWLSTGVLRWETFPTNHLFAWSFKCISSTELKQPPAVILSGLSVYVPYITIPYNCLVQYTTAQEGVCCDPTPEVPTKATTETLKCLPEISALRILRNLPAWF